MAKKNSWQRRVNVNTAVIVIFSVFLFGLGAYWRSLAMDSSFVQSCAERYTSIEQQEEFQTCLHEYGTTFEHDHIQKENLYIFMTILSFCGLVTAFVYKNHAKAVFDQEKK